MVRADGREVPTEIAALGTYTMRNTRYHVGVYRDISDRKRTEQALVRSEKLYRTLMENSADGIKLINRDGAILNANRAAWEMLGYSRDELLALTVPEIDPDWSRERFQTFWDTRATPQPVFVQTHHRHRDGTLIPVEITAIPCDLDDERFVFGISRDISLRLA